jgi:thiol-disulfide isomerase/thioredoxin
MRPQLQRVWHRAAILAALALSGHGMADAASTSMAFELPMLDGSKFVRLADFDGRPVLLNFWGSECPPCASEMPLLLSLSSHYADVQFLGIAVDDRASATRWIAQFEPRYPQLMAPAQPEVLMRRFGDKLAALPYTVVLNSQHRICTARLGEVDATWVASAIANCAAGPPAATTR